MNKKQALLILDHFAAASILTIVTVGLFLLYSMFINSHKRHTCAYAAINKEAKSFCDQWEIFGESK